MAPMQLPVGQTIRAAAVALVLSAVFGSQTLAMTIRTKDDAAKDPSFVEFRKELRLALRNGDIEAVVRMAAPNVKFTYGRDTGIGRRQFRQYLSGKKATCGSHTPEGGSYYRLHLHTMLGQGGVFRNGGTTFETGPTKSYLHRRARVKGGVWPPESPDKAFILKVNIPVRLAPQIDAEVMARLHHRHPVQLGEGLVTTKLQPGIQRVLWRSVKLASGQIGWLCAADYYELVGYRASFEKRNGRWHITHIRAAPQ